MDNAKPKMDRVTVTFTGKVNPKTEAIKDFTKDELMQITGRKKG